MTLIKSISGIRGTIGGHAGEGLNPLDIVKFTSAYATLIRKTTTVKSNKIVVGRDARISGEMVKNVVCGTLMGMGFDVVNIGLASTPTTELAVTMEGACGGIIVNCRRGGCHYTTAYGASSDCRDGRCGVAFDCGRVELAAVGRLVGIQPALHADDELASAGVRGHRVVHVEAGLLD